MMSLNQAEIPTELHINYLKTLISKIFKILPMKEQNTETVNVHIDSLLSELVGYTSLFTFVNNDARLVTVMSTLQSLKECDLQHSVYKREIFKCIKCVEQIIEEAS